MIKADEAKRVTAEAQEAHKKHQTLKEAKRLESLFKARMRDADEAVKQATVEGLEMVNLRLSHDQLPRQIRERFEDQVRSDGYEIHCHCNDDDGDGYEILISWRIK